MGGGRRRRGDRQERATVTGRRRAAAHVSGTPLTAPCSAVVAAAGRKPVGRSFRQDGPERDGFPVRLRLLRPERLSQHGADQRGTGRYCEP
ncbi:hypothetical protein GTW40_10465 [Streptomyces sp. SID4985]|nr:hypothetical protein [Streptomyces sp. SID4985]